MVLMNVLIISSCRRREDKWVVAMNRWQDLTDMEVNKGKSFFSLVALPKFYVDLNFPRLLPQLLSIFSQSTARESLGSLLPGISRYTDSRSRLINLSGNSSFMLLMSKVYVKVSTSNWWRVRSPLSPSFLEITDDCRLVPYRIGRMGDNPNNLCGRSQK